jgi:Profilin
LPINQSVFGFCQSINQSAYSFYQSINQSAYSFYQSINQFIVFANQSINQFISVSALIVCVYEEPVLPEQAASVTEKLGEYLISVGY